MIKVGKFYKNKETDERYVVVVADLDRGIITIKKDRDDVDDFDICKSTFLMNYDEAA